MIDHERSGAPHVIFQLFDFVADGTNYWQQLLKRKYNGNFGREFTKVFVCVRPQSIREIKKGDHVVVQTNHHKNSVQVITTSTAIGEELQLINENSIDSTMRREFIVDGVFDFRNKLSMDGVWKDFGEEMVDHFLRGFNYSLISFGQTGSGKTFTLMHRSESEKGLVSMFGESTFRQLKEQSNFTQEEFVIEMSILHIYNESCYDLLNNCYKKLRTRETVHSGVYVENMTRHQVMSEEQIQNLVQKARRNNAIMQTNMGQSSSRSSVIYSFHLSISNQPVVRRSTIQFVELAGSEALTPTDTRQPESLLANNSIHTFARIQHSLDCRRPKVGHIFYRDSNLTRLLQESLGGNCRTIMLFHLSPSSSCIKESLFALNHSTVAKYVMTKPNPQTTFL